MKNLKFIFSILSFCVLYQTQCFSQTSFATNNPTTGAFLGWNGAQNLDFRTNNINRMRLMETGTDIIDLYPVDVSGNLGLSTDPTFFGFKPYSLLHLDGGNSSSPQTQGFRPWMRHGITFTHNGDLMYVGPMKKGLSTDKTDAVIAVLPVIDSIRKIDLHTSIPIPRHELVAVQTPQCFKTDLIKRAYQSSYNIAFTDDASVAASANIDVELVEGNRTNLKITTAEDLAIAEALIAYNQII